MDIMQKRLRWPRKSWPVGLLLLVALLAACGSQRISLQNHPQGNSSAYLPQRAQTLSTLSGMLTSIHMVDAHTGWLVSWQTDGDGSYHILRTTDGGVHWQDTLTCTSTVSMGGGFVKGCDTNFYSATVATVVQPEYDTQTNVSRLRIFHTADGGQTWRSSELVAADLQTPATFVDALHGWALVTENFPGPDPGSAYIGQEISLYRTMDGGYTWQRVAHGPSTSQLSVTSDDGYGVAPLTANAQMTFSSPTTGWLMGRTYQSNNTQQAWLYVTHDGGASWQPSSLVFPANEDAPSAPVFFDTQDGALLADVTGPAPQNTQSGMLYVTHDGGQTWNATPVPLVIADGASIDPEQAWTVAANSTHVLYTTSDGWLHWTKTQVQTSFKNIGNFDFISPTTGWALANNQAHFLPEPDGGAIKGEIISLLKTTDGGKTWQTITYSQV